MGRLPKVARPRNLGLNDSIPLGLGNGFGRDAENGNRDGRAPRQSPSRAANGSLRWTINKCRVIPIGMDKSDIAIVTSIASFAVAALSLALTAFRDFRDRSCLKAESKFNPKNDGMPARIRVEAKNTGRRPVVLTALGGKYEDGNRLIINVGDGRGVQLSEKEKHIETIENHLLFFGANCSPLKDIWLEDTAGQHYSIKGAKRHLEMIFNSAQ